MGWMDKNKGRAEKKSRKSLTTAPSKQLFPEEKGTLRE